MKNLILVAVILQLAITIIEINGEYEFGDIIAFPRLFTIGKKPVYKHYAIYVGNNTAYTDIGQGHNDIFHRTDKTKGFQCAFAQLEETRRGKQKEQKDNYFDGIQGIKPGSKASIKKRIMETSENCNRYKLLSNNCEHLATYVRYGLSISMQHGALSKFLFKQGLDPTKVRELLERIQIEEEEEAKCQALRADANRQVSYQPVLSACLVILCIIPHMTFVTENFISI